MESNNYETAIIILNYMNYIQTFKCVDNLLNLEISADIVVVDNASINDSYSMIHDRYEENKKVHVIKSNKNNGYSSGNNIGIRYIAKLRKKIKYIAIMNPDVILLSKDTIDKNIEILRLNKDIAAITSVIEEEGCVNVNRSGWKLPSILRVLCMNLHFLSKLSTYIQNKELFQERNGVRYVDAVHGSFFIIKYDIFKSVNFFDENVFLYYEENILAWRMKKLGYRMAINLKDRYLHNHEYHKMYLKELQKSTSIMKFAQQYYLKKYVNCNLLIRYLILYMYNFYIYIELPMVKLISGMKHKLKK